MIGHLQIAAKRRELDRARREKVREAMAEYDKAHRASLQELYEACSRIGHHWQRSDFGSSGDPEVCRICGAVK